MSAAPDYAQYPYPHDIASPEDVPWSVLMLSTMKLPLRLRFAWYRYLLPRFLYCGPITVWRMAGDTQFVLAYFFANVATARKSLWASTWMERASERLADIRRGKT